MKIICKNTNKTEDHNYITQSIKRLDHYKTHPNPSPIPSLTTTPYLRTKKSI